MVQDGHIQFQLPQQSASQEQQHMGHSQVQQEHVELSQIQQQHIDHSQSLQQHIDQSQIQQQHMEHSEIQQQMQQAQIQQQIQHSHIPQQQIQQSHIQQQQIQQSHIQQQQQIQQPHIQAQQVSQSQVQPQIQQSQIQQQIPQSQIQSQIQQVAVSVPLSNNVQQTNQINASASVPFTVTAINASQAQQIQAFPQNINSNSGTPVQIAVSQLTPQSHSVQGGNLISQTSGPYPTVMHSTMSVAQSPLQHSIVNTGALMTASGQVIGTSPKTNFAQQIMGTAGKTAVIHSQSGFASSNQAIIGTVDVLQNQHSVYKAVTDPQKGKTYTFLNQPQTLQPLYSSPAQGYSGNQLKQMNSQPHIITAQMPGNMFNQAQIIGSLPPLPQGMSWAIPGNFQSPTVFAPNPILLPGQQSLFIQPSPQNSLHLPTVPAPAPVATNSYGVSSNMLQRSKPRLRPKGKNILPSFINATLQPPAPYRLVAAQTQTNQSTPRNHSDHQPSPLPKFDVANQTLPNEMKSIIIADIKCLSAESKSVGVEAKQVSSQLPMESKDMVSSSTEIEQNTACFTASVSVATVTSSAATMTSTTSVVTSSAVTTTSTTSIVSSSATMTTMSVTSNVTSSAHENIIVDSSSVVQQNSLYDSSTAVDEKSLLGVSSDVQGNVLVNISHNVQDNTLIDVSSDIQENTLVDVSPNVQEDSAVIPVMTSSEMSTSPSNLLDDIEITDSDVKDSVLAPEISEGTINQCEQLTDNKSVEKETIPQLVTPLKPVAPVKEKPRQKAIVKPQVLTHVIDGFVIQEGSEPFPVSRSSLLPDVSEIVKPVERVRMPEEGDPPAEKKMKIYRPRGRPRKRRSQFRNSKEQNQNSSQKLDSSVQELINIEDAVLNTNTVEESPSTVTEVLPVEEKLPNVTSTVEKILEVEAEKTELDVTKKLPVKWSVQEVFEFIKSLPGYSDYADEFKSQEIDGQALMLLKHDHLMTNMSMKLGPAVKLISHIDSIKEQLLDT